jgi:putative intracellular protease/amidase
MQQVAVLLYPGCVFFEIALAAETLAPRFAITFLTPDGEDHRGSNGATVVSDGPFVSLLERDLAAVLVPGGDPRSLLMPKRQEIDHLAVLANRRVVVAGICAGNLILAAGGVLANRRGTHNYTTEHAPPEGVAATAHYWEGMYFERKNLVQDANVITAQPWAYREYAASVAEALGAATPVEAKAIRDYPNRHSYASIDA